MSADTLPDANQFDAYLMDMVEAGASDLFLVSQAPPSIKVGGVVQAMKLPPLTAPALQSLAAAIMSDAQIKQFEVSHECDLALAVPGLARFRVNVYVQRGDIAMVVRHIPSTVPSFETLKLPPIVKTLAMQRRGLVLIVGSVGSGKSTTLASMLDYRNANAPGHILTVEDPIEFYHSHKKAIVSQREVGIDTLSFDEALRHAMREAPDVIMIGEVRDATTLQHAVHYAESGHLCVTTMHANNANQAIERMLNFVEQGQHKRMLMDLSLNLRGIVAQRLVPGVDARLVLATEVMLQSSYVSDLIHKGQVEQIKLAMAKSTEVGMHTFDQSLFDLYSEGRLTLEQAIENADSKNDLALRARLDRKPAFRNTQS